MLNILNTFGATTYYDKDYFIGPSLSSSTDLSGWVTAATVLGLVGAILVYFLFVKSKDKPANKFLSWLKDFLDFKKFWIEDLLKVLYYFATIYVIIFSFAFISIDAGAWLAVLILGPVAVRLCYELVMLFIMIWKNTSEIEKHTRKIAETSGDISGITGSVKKTVKNASAVVSEVRGAIVDRTNEAREAIEGGIKETKEAAAKAKKDVEEGVENLKKSAEKSAAEAEKKAKEAKKDLEDKIARAEKEIDEN